VEGVVESVPEVQQGQGLEARRAHHDALPQPEVPHFDDAGARRGRQAPTVLAPGQLRRPARSEVHLRPTSALADVPQADLKIP